ncbi:MAG: undecaprenyldiphospho-muramoylpentapeptide beta-N-acetylglucosaminyltransferase [Prevotella sp.]|nr:undecaprenyldiphospho-muramoylpentapeptide beta-N-acetylglucosaminyltransferase [Prevotella sp.]
MDKELRIIISGGGTGGHIFPAVSIANAVRSLRPDAKILFVGAQGRMEMQRVPAAGYEIKGLPISGFDRKNLLKNVSLPFKLLRSWAMAWSILRQFRPQVAVGVGGYASYPTLKVASWMNIPTLIQEQNSFAGKANIRLAKKAARCCVAFEGMERFFPANRIMLTGNPVRTQMLETTLTREQAIGSLGLNPQRKTVLIVGGSLGARTLNEAVLSHLEAIAASGVQFIWQTGKYYHASITEELQTKEQPANLKVMDFITDMGAAYRAADLVISRAGASSVSEFCLIGKPVIMVPSPNVTEDHQTKNAMALVNKEAALIVSDADAKEQLIDLAIKTVQDDEKLSRLSVNVKKLALPDSAEIIAKEVIKLAKQ